MRNIAKLGKAYASNIQSFCTSFLQQGKLGRFSFIFFLCALVFSVVGIHGFMRGHMGWLSPDLYSSAVNLDITRNFLARGIMDDGGIITYHHHPTLAFRFFNFASHFGYSYFDKLQVAYVFSAIVLCAGWYALYVVYKKMGFDSTVAMLTVMAMATTKYFLFYRAVLSFDNFTILASAGLIYAFYIFENDDIAALGIEKKIVALAICILCLNLSWYFYPVIGCFFASLFVVRLFKCGDWKTPFFAGFFIFSVMLLIIGLIVYDNIRVLGNYNDLVSFLINDAPSSQLVAGERYQPAMELLSGLAGRMLSLAPGWIILGVCVLLLCSIKFSKSTQRPVVKTRLSIFSFLVGGVAFIGLTRYWSFIHPFAFPLVQVGLGLALLVALSYVHPKFNFALQLVIFALAIYGTNRLCLERKADIAEAKATSSLLDVVEAKFYGGYAFSLSADCGAFSGKFPYISTAPNRVLSVNESKFPIERQIELVCLDAKSSQVLLKTRDGKQQYIVRYGEAGFETLSH